ncbi:MAG: LysM peptidoglycan-binding domain-containing protein [Planctomycetaceae bacterium]|nr:LysM peptidoglycan-binding domain-containing protein [Planctomycetaceae bacterium]
MEALKNTSMMIILAGIFYGAYQMIVSEPPNWQKKGDSTEMISADDPSLPQQNPLPQNPVPQNPVPQNPGFQNQTLGNSGSLTSTQPSLATGSNSQAWSPSGATGSNSPGTPPAANVRYPNSEFSNSPGLGAAPTGGNSMAASGVDPMSSSMAPGLPRGGVSLPSENNLAANAGTNLPAASGTGALSQAGFSEASGLPPSPSATSSTAGLPTGLPPVGVSNNGLPVQPAAHNQPMDRSPASPTSGLPTSGLPNVGTPSGSDLLPIRSQPGLPATPPAASDALSSTQRLKAAMESAGVDIQNNNWAKALHDLSAWYQQPISVEDRDHLVGWLDRLAGDVIYSNKHTLTAGHQVQSGETLASIAGRYQMPPRLLARINQYPDSIAEETPLQQGAELKVIPGPFTAEADLQLGQLTLYAGGLYAGRFKFRTGESAPLESLSEPVSFISVQGIPAQEDQRRHEPLAPTNPFGRYCLVVGQTAVLHSPGGNSQGSCLEFSEQDMLDLMVLLPRGTMVRVVR